MRACADSGCGELSTRSRCPKHRAAEDRRQARTVPTKLNRNRDRQRRGRAVDEHKAKHGAWCRGFGRDPHSSTDLTADHVVEQADGGAWDGELEVLCRSCNSRKNRLAQVRRAKRYQTP
ncbi:HNH endonuclease [Gordonia malaquae]|uniref:HNH endonuclease n=1 Tax=Gordonia malaquae TaxID=410332 RepID=UPI0030196185